MAGITDYMRKEYVFLFITVLIFLISKNVGIFWDNVLFVSKIGGHFYENGLLALPLPELIDPAKPPFFSMLHTISWHIFGKHLWVTHLVQMPFVYFLLVQVYKFIGFFIKDTRHLMITFILVLFEPTLSAQIILVSPEVIQVSLFFFSINSILYNKDRSLLLGLLLMSMVSYRGMMLCGGIFIFDTIFSCMINDKGCRSKGFLKNKVFIYAIGSIPSFIYLSWRYINTGWIYTSPNSPWLEFSGFVDINGFIRNVIVLGHRFVDFGRVFLFIIMFGFLYKYKPKDKLLYILLTAFVSASAVVALVSLLSKNPMGHRYFLSSFIILVVIVSYLIQRFSSHIRIMYFIVFLSFIVGNLIVYPRQIAQGWDASLAFVPYFSLREEAIDYLENHNILVEETATFYPNLTKVSNISFNKDDRSFIKFTGYEEYLLYSNISNLSDEELEIIDKKYHLIKDFHNIGVVVEIYQINK